MTIIHYSPILQTVISHLDYSSRKKFIISSKNANNYKFLEKSINFEKKIILFQKYIRRYIRNMKYLINPNNDRFYFTRKNVIRYYNLEYPNKYYLEYPEFALNKLIDEEYDKVAMKEYIDNLPPIKDRKRKMIKEFMTKFLTKDNIFYIGW